jgi:hypothetical protein
MIDYAIRWLDINAGLLEQMGIVVIEHCKSPEDTEVSSFHVDFASSTSAGRLTLWETGDCDVELLDIPLSESQYLEHLEVYDNSDIDSAYRFLLDVILQRN